jgi:Zn-dependent protease/CBS domain-containing protein
MPTRSAITLLRVRGIRIGVDWSWFVFLFLIILFLSGFYKDVLNTPDGSTTPYVLAVASALLFFASIVLHELGHAFMALRKGIGVSSITLWLFGGVARLDRDTDSPGTEFKIAAAGPAVTLVLLIGFGAAGAAIEGSAFFDGVGNIVASAFFGATDRFAGGNADLSAVGAVLVYLTFINLILLAFNLIPAFPLDGGRIARAIAWRATDDRRRATRIAATLGQGFGYLLMGVAVLALLRGDAFDALWWGFLGFVLNGAARGAILQSEFTSPIEGLQVSDVMDREPVAMPAELSVAQALDEYFLRYQWPWFPVVDEAGQFRGLIERGQVEAVPEVERTTTQVEALLPEDTSGHSDLLSVSEDSPLEAVLANQALRNLGALAAVDADGRLRGVLTADAVGRALRQPAAGTQL